MGSVYCILTEDERYHLSRHSIAVKDLIFIEEELLKVHINNFSGDFVIYSNMLKLDKPVLCVDTYLEALEALRHIDGSVYMDAGSRIAELDTSEKGYWNFTETGELPIKSYL